MLFNTLAEMGSETQRVLLGGFQHAGGAFEPGPADHDSIIDMKRLKMLRVALTA